MRCGARRPALRRDVAVSVVDAAIPACAGGRSARRVPEDAWRFAQLAGAGQGACARTQGGRAAQRRRAAADVQDSDQFILRLPGFFARPFQRLRRGQRIDETRTRSDSARSGETRRTGRAGYRGRYRRNLFHPAPPTAPARKARTGCWRKWDRLCPRESGWKSTAVTARCSPTK